jgi:hypothetical protein
VVLETINLEWYITKLQVKNKKRTIYTIYIIIQQQFMLLYKLKIKLINKLIE